MLTQVCYASVGRSKRTPKLLVRSSSQPQASSAHPMTPLACGASSMRPHAGRAVRSIIMNCSGRCQSPPLRDRWRQRPSMQRPEVEPWPNVNRQGFTKAKGLQPWWRSSGTCSDRQVNLQPWWRSPAAMVEIKRHLQPWSRSSGTCRDHLQPWWK